jgi:hypothetical protein
MNQVVGRDIVIRRSHLNLLERDMPGAALLSHIVYWFSPPKDGTSKFSVQRDGKYWIAKTREEWMEECGITHTQYLRVMPILKSLGLVEVRVMKFGGQPMTHVRLLHENFDVWSSGRKPPIHSAPFGRS